MYKIINLKNISHFYKKRTKDITTKTIRSLDLKVDPCPICQYEDDGYTCPYVGQVKEDCFICDRLQLEENTHPNIVAEYLKQCYYFKTLQDTKEVYIFVDGVYQPNGEIVIEVEVQKLMEKPKTHYINEVIGCIQRSTYIDRAEFDKDLNLLTVKNGVLNIKTGILLDFDPTILSTVKLPIKYDPNAKCREIEKFLSEIVDKKDIELLKEIFDYILEPSYFIHKAFMLIGEGSNGKSTFSILLTYFSGKENCSNEPLQDLVYGRFVVAELHGKLLNIFNDLSNIVLKQTGKFKGLCSGDRIKGEKKFKNQFYFTNRAKLIFSTNTLPKTEDVSDAFFRRWIIITFPKQIQ